MPKRNDVKIARERRLLKRFKAGDKSAFDALWKPHTAKIFGLAMRVVRDVQLAEDVVQNTAISMYRHLAAFRGDAMIQSWLYRLAFNESCMVLRKRRRFFKGEVIDIDGPDFDKESYYLNLHPGEISLRAMPYRAVAAREALAAINRICKSEPTGEAVFLSAAGYTNEELAALTKTSVPAIKSRLHRARHEVLRRCWEYRRAVNE